jgi:hypothetical protein
MAQVTLAGAGPVSSDWSRALMEALQQKASVGSPLSADCIEEISHAISRTPPHWPGWLRADPDFVAAHGWTLQVYLAAEAWKATVMKPLDGGAGLVN